MVGPMARTVDDLIFATKSMIDLVQKPSTLMPGETLLPIPWDEPDANQRLNIGYTYYTGAVKMRAQVRARADGRPARRATARSWRRWLGSRSWATRSSCSILRIVGCSSAEIPLTAATEAVKASRPAKLD